MTPAGLPWDSSAAPRRLLLLLSFLCAAVLLALAADPAGGPAAWAGEEGEEEPPTGPPPGDPVAAAEAFDTAEVKREELDYTAAANAYWKAVEADILHYRAHVHYQQMSLALGDDRKTLLADYDSFVEEFPKHVALRLHRLRLDPPADRLSALKDLAKAHPKDFNVHLETGRALLAQGEAKQAVRSLEKAFAVQPGDRPDILLLLAEAEVAAGQSDDARDHLEAAVKGRPDFWQARMALARLDLREEQYEKALEHVEVVVQHRTTMIAAVLVKSEALAATGKVEEGKTLLQHVYERITKGVPDVAIALADLTAKFETEAVLEVAAGLYKAVIEAEKGNWRAFYGLGWVQERQEKYADAERNYREVLDIRPDLVEAVNSVGVSLFKQGRVSEAQVQFKRALDMDPKFVLALANLGSTLDAQAKYGEAIKLYEKILKMKGQDENLRALINCAFDHEATGSFSKAAKLLLRAHEILPKDADICVWVGDNCYFQKKWKDAESWYQKAIALDAKSFFAWRGLGLALMQLRRWADAASALEKAHELTPDDLDLLVTLGDLYYDQLDDLEKALKSYQEYVQRGGSDPEVTDAITEILKELEKKK